MLAFTVFAVLSLAGVLNIPRLDRTCGRIIQRIRRH